MMEELNSETMILLLSVLISNCNFCNSTVCEDSAINIYHSPSVICHILFGVNDVIIDCEISNNNVCVKHFVLYDFVFVVLPSIVCEDSARLLVCILLTLNILLKWIILILLFLMVY